MSRQKILFPILPVLLMSSACFSIFYATATEDDVTADEDVPVDTDQVRYEEAQLRLTEALLKQAVENNKSVPGLIASSEIERLHLNVELSKDLLAKAELGKRDLSNDFFLLFCQDQISSIKSDLVKAIDVRKAVPTRVSEADIEVLRARLELAEVELAEGKLAIRESSISETQWKLNILLKEVLRLSRESVQSKPR